MKAAVLTEQRPDLVISEVDDATPGPGEVVLKVSRCGICGSDLHLARVAPAGTVLGHEIAGEVAAHGPEVPPETPPVGTAVAARPLIGCRRCRWCLAGRPDHCADFKLVGLERPGGFAEAVAVAADECWTLPAQLDGSDHALVEPFAVARRALRRARLAPGEKVVVLGGGPIGLAVAHWAKALGAGPLLLSDPEPDRRRLGTELGADVVVDPTTVPLPAEAPAHLNGPPDLVIECSGRPGLIEEGLEVASVEGRLVVVGVCAGPDTVVPWFGILKELDVRFSVYYGRQDYTDTVEAFAGGLLRPSDMVTDTIALAELPDRFGALVARADGGKVLVRS